MQTTRFTLHDNVFDLLIGNNLYKSAYTAVRELLQNAEDACSLQKIKDPTYSPSISVRYSTSGNWVEVVDDGLGMNEESLEKSFASIGASKQDVPYIQELLKQSGNTNFQIGKFGIGILSCFGVAEKVEVKTKMDNETGLAFTVVGPKEDFQPIENLPAVRGTSVKLFLKPDGVMKADQVPNAVEEYARHASFIEIENADTQDKTRVQEKWKGAKVKGAIEIKDEFLSGFLALNPTWDTGATVQSSLTVCNGGFLVSENEKILLPQQAIGYTGEINVVPGTLTILMNREGFQQDEKWTKLGQHLLTYYNQLIKERIDELEKSLEDDPKGANINQIDKYIAVLYFGPTKAILQQDVIQKIESMIPKVIRIRELGSERKLSIKKIIDKASDKKRIYYTVDESPHAFQQSIQQGSFSAQITETIQTKEIRIANLLLKGEVVVHCQSPSFPIEVNGQTQNISYSESALLEQECIKNSYRWTRVDSASAEEVMLDPMEESSLFSKLLDLEFDFRLVDLPGVKDRVVRDDTGKLMNFSSNETKEIVKIIPEVAGNPVRKKLLQIYLDLDSAYGTFSAQRKIKELLTDPELYEKAQLETSPLLKAFLTRKVTQLLEKEEKK